MRNTVFAALAAVIVTAGAAWSAQTPEQKCEGAKNDAAGKYAACIAKAQKNFVRTDDPTRKSEDLADCNDKLTDKWNKIQTQAVAKGGACPSSSDLSSTKSLLDAAMAGTANTVGGGGDTPICSVGDACVGETDYDILFQLDNAVALTSLQYDVNYVGAAGVFEGTGPAVTCTSLVVAETASAFNDNEGIATLVGAVIKLAPGMVGPGLPIATCRFVSTGPVPSAGDFGIVVVDAADLALNAVLGVTVSIGSITVTP